MIYQELEKLGFSEKEALVYASSLELGPASIQSIAQKAGIKRPTTYFIMEELMERGLVSSFHKGKKQFFVAENPERIAEIFDQEDLQVRQKREQFKNILPQLQSINNKDSGKPVVRFFEGKDGIVSMMKEHFESNRDQGAFMIFSRDAIESTFSKDDLTSFLNQRIQKKITAKTIYTWSKGPLEPNEKTQRIRLNEKEFPITCDIAVFKDRIRITSLINRIVGISIEDKEVAKSFEIIFSKLFELLEKTGYSEK